MRTSRTFQRVPADRWVHGYAGPTYSNGNRIEVIKSENGNWMVMVGQGMTWATLLRNVSFTKAMRQAHISHQQATFNQEIRP